MHEIRHLLHESIHQGRDLPGPGFQPLLQGFVPAGDDDQRHGQAGLVQRGGDGLDLTHPLAAAH